MVMESIKRHENVMKIIENFNIQEFKLIDTIFVAWKHNKTINLTVWMRIFGCFKTILIKCRGLYCKANNLGARSLFYNFSGLTLAKLHTARYWSALTKTNAELRNL
jgi:hypothetical protein